MCNHRVKTMRHMAISKFLCKEIRILWAFLTKAIVSGQWIALLAAALKWSCSIGAILCTGPHSFILQTFINICRFCTVTHYIIVQKTNCTVIYIDTLHILFLWMIWFLLKLTQQCVTNILFISLLYILLYFETCYVY